MEFTNFFVAIFVTVVLGTLEIKSEEDLDIHTTIQTKLPIATQDHNPLSGLILNQQDAELNDNKKYEDILSRVKRQYGYDPYYGRQRYYPYPLPIFIGLGGFGIGPRFGGRGFGGGGFGGRGFGGRGFGGRGFGGRGIGGRGFGGIGGRGIGGIGGRGGIGGGRGGGRG